MSAIWISKVDYIFNEYNVQLLQMFASVYPYWIHLPDLMN